MTHSEYTLLNMAILGDTVGLTTLLAIWYEVSNLLYAQL